MPNLNYLQSEARKLAEQTANGEVAALARLVAQLCRECEDIEHPAAAAQAEAREASVAAKR